MKQIVNNDDSEDSPIASNSKTVKIIKINRSIVQATDKNLQL